MPTVSSSASSKAALTTLSLTARKELSKDRITVSVVSPFLTATNLEGSALKTPHNPFRPESGVGMPVFDDPSVPAAKIVEALQSGKALQPVRPLWYILFAFGRSSLKARFRPAT